MVKPLPPPNNGVQGRDGFVGKLSFSGSTLSLAYSTYLGGSGLEGEGNAITVDSSGNAYVTGTTGSSDFPISAGAFQRTLRGGGDAFVSKLTFNDAVLRLQYSTYFG